MYFSLGGQVGTPDLKETKYLLITKHLLVTKISKVTIDAHLKGGGGRGGMKVNTLPPNFSKLVNKNAIKVIKHQKGVLPTPNFFFTTSI
jgi:hypothetical protein